MHEWGDGWKYWDDMGKMVEMAYEVFEPMPTWPIKEKYGSLRYNLYYGDVDAVVYREGYRKLLEAYPHLKTEIMFDATWREFLEGLVDENECSHEHCWVTHAKGKEVEWCGTCGKEKTLDK